jgi:hypothetical protein
MALERGARLGANAASRDAERIFHLLGGEQLLPSG